MSIGRNGSFFSIANVTQQIWDCRSGSVFDAGVLHRQQPQGRRRCIEGCMDCHGPDGPRNDGVYIAHIGKFRLIDNLG